MGTAAGLARRPVVGSRLPSGFVAPSPRPMQRDEGHDDCDDEGDDAGQAFGLSFAEKRQLELDALLGHWCDSQKNGVAPRCRF